MLDNKVLKNDVIDYKNIEFIITLCDIFHRVILLYYKE